MRKNDKLTVSTEEGVEVYGRALGGRCRYRKRAGELREAPVGEPTTVNEEANGCLKVINTGPSLATATEELEGSFLQNLRSYGGEWFWEDLCTPDGIEWMPEAMSRRTLTSVTDDSYIRHLAPNVCGAGWIIQDKLTGKKVKGLLAEWSSSAGSHRGEILGMLAVRVFLLAVEKYFQQHGRVGEGN